MFRSVHEAMPTHIPLSCIQKNIPIIYRPIHSTAAVSVRCTQESVIFYGAVECFATCMPHVIIWLKKQAKVILGNWLRDLSVQYHLPFQKLSIRAQKTVWGSCTACKNIQLNYKILFLPAQLARYILIHELCHTVHMNHSRAFWALVACYVPQYRECIKQLKQADHHMPRWISL